MNWLEQQDRNRTPGWDRAPTRFERVEPEVLRACADELFAGRSTECTSGNLVPFVRVPGRPDVKLLAQNPHTHSRFAAMARNGQHVAWLVPADERVGRVYIARVIEHDVCYLQPERTEP